MSGGQSMEHEILHEGKRILYEIRTSAQAKRVRIAVPSATRCVVTVPRRCLISRAVGCVEANVAWIAAAQEKIRTRVTPQGDREEYLRMRERARAIATERLRYFNAHYGFCYRSVSIRNARTRWGSCSKSGTISFSYKIAILPPELVDYLVVHELCHCEEMNHSERFWRLVEAALPDYKRLRLTLRRLKK